jgi:hypothetical protein
MSKNTMIDRVKELRENNICLFRGVLCDCNHNGKFVTEKNHLIQKSNYLKRISNQNRVMVFDIEHPEYYRKKGEMTQVHIDKAYTYHVLCGAHDKLLFNEIENGNEFDENNKKQCFQYALRTFIFEYSQVLIKKNFENMVHHFYEKVATAHQIQYEKDFNRFKDDLISEKWDDLETIAIILNKEIQFVSGFYGRPIFDINKKYVLSTKNLFINLFPRNSQTVILLSYFKNSSNTLKKYCKTLSHTANNHEYDKLEKYLTKLILIHDKNLAMNPVFYSKMEKEEKEDFYKYAFLLRKTHYRLIGKKWLTLKYGSCKFNLFLSSKVPESNILS